MSQETRQWLSENILVGFTEKRGNAWHYREGDDNHYAGPIPVEDVRSRLFNWMAEERPLFIPAGPNDVRDYTWANGPLDKGLNPVPDRKAIVRSDNGVVLGIFKDGYQPHQYSEWLIQNVSHILDDDLYIGSAGLLKNGGVAWVSVEVPENIVTPEGVEFRPNLIAATSFDGSLATTYARHVTNVVCDNTMNLALSEKGSKVKVRHSRNSLYRIADVREALDIIHSASQEFEREVRELTSRKFSDQDFDKLVDLLAPMPDAKNSKTTRGLTIAEAKRDTYRRLWLNDERCAPFRGTAFGAWQVVNTFNHHEGREPNKGTTRAERNMLFAVNGTTEKADREALDKIMELAA